MRDHSNHIELSRQEAVRQLFDALEQGDYAGKTTQKTENVALDEAFGRTLAVAVKAKTDIPNVLTCGMDSVAVHWSAFEGLAEGELPDSSAWVRGRDWQFANTGVAMPEGFDTAIVIEHVEVSADEQHITIDAAPSAQYAGTRQAGSNMREGEIVAGAGTLITPDVAASIAGAGTSTVCVRRRPRVAFIPTGNELCYPNLPYACDAPEKYAARGHVYEANSFVVRGKVEAWGGTYVPFDIVPDDREKIRAAVELAAEVSDIVVLNAGSSKGSDDWSVEVLEEMGHVICHQTNHGPGHHSSMSVVMNSNGCVVPVVGISGPAGGASFTLNFYLRPVIEKFLGQNTEPKMIKCRLAESFGPNRFAPGAANKKQAGEHKPPEVAPGETFFGVRPMKLEIAEDGTLLAYPVKGRPGSPESKAANAIYMLESGPAATPPQPGSIIEVELR